MHRSRLLRFCQARISAPPYGAAAGGRGGQRWASGTVCSAPAPRGLPNTVGSDWGLARVGPAAGSSRCSGIGGRSSLLLKPSSMCIVCFY